MYIIFHWHIYGFLCRQICKMYLLKPENQPTMFILHKLKGKFKVDSPHLWNLEYLECSRFESLLIYLFTIKIQMFVTFVFSFFFFSYPILLKFYLESNFITIYYKISLLKSRVIVVVTLFSATSGMFFLFSFLWLTECHRICLA